MATKHRPGRSKRPCKANYNNAKRWIDNKIRRIRRHLRRCPNDTQSSAALDRALSRK